MKVTLIQATPNPIETIAQIASICYDSDPKNPLGLVKHLYRNGHHSVFEHIYFTFKIEGISRACSHQLVRHRHCSFTQRSQRYCSEEVARLNTLKNKRRDSIYEDIYFTIQCEVGHNLSREKAILIWNYAWERGHAYGIREVCCYLEELIDLVDKLLGEVKK